MTEPGTDLDRHDPAKPLPVLAGKELEETFRIAKALAQSGLFKDAKKEMEAFAKILAGRDLGLSPFEAMSSLHVIEGKIEASADLQASRVKASGRYDYKMDWLHDNETDEVVGCRIEFFEEGEKLGESEFTMDDARQAGLADKAVWKKYPRNLLFARAMSNGVAWYCPDVMGGLRVYHEGEIEVRDVSAGSGDYTEPESMVDAVKAWAPSPELANSILATVERAQELGHVGLADYGTLELRLKGKNPDAISAWLRDANQTLDGLAELGGRVADVAAVSETRPSEDESLTAEILQARAEQKADEADSLEQDDPGRAEELRAEAASLHDQAEAMRQQEMEV